MEYIEGSRLETKMTNKLSKHARISQSTVYRYKNSNYLFLYESPKRLSDIKNEPCYFNILGKKSVILGTMINGKFSPNRHYNLYCKNLSKIYEIKRTNCYATLTKALEVFLSEKD